MAKYEDNGFQRLSHRDLTPSQKIKMRRMIRAFNKDYLSGSRVRWEISAPHADSPLKGWVSLILINTTTGTSSLYFESRVHVAITARGRVDLLGASDGLMDSKEVETSVKKTLKAFSI